MASTTGGDSGAGGGALAEGRRHFAAAQWQSAHACLTQADAEQPLGAEDLERLADAAYLLGDDDAFFEAMERAQRAHQGDGEPARAARCAFWLGMHSMFRGEMGRSMGWFGRAQRLLESHAPCAEHGYLRVPEAEQKLAERDFAAAGELAAEVVGIGERFGDADLVAIALHQQGLANIHDGNVRQGLSQLDEAMLAATSGELTPRVTGLLYCSVIDGCQQVLAVDRAAEWTEALKRWCDAQPSMVSFTGKCLIHRAEILQLGGAWTEAIEEADRALDRLARSADSPAAAHYQQGEVLRLRGELAEAEEAYRRVSQAGGDPQPGLSLLRLAQGRGDQARASIRRVERTTEAPLERARLLPAFVEIMLATGELGEARRGSDELGAIAERFGTDVLRGMAASARGAVELAAGDAATAARCLGDALASWERAEVPYELARTQRLLGAACAALGDEDGSAMRSQAAEQGFSRLGATWEMGGGATATPAATPGEAAPSPLSPRELEVLQRVASGDTNKEIAAALSLSVKTVERHLSNIFTKLDVPTRAAATAYAYRHGLV